MSPVEKPQALTAKTWDRGATVEEMLTAYATAARIAKKHGLKRPDPPDGWYWFDDENLAWDEYHEDDWMKRTASTKS